MPLTDLEVKAARYNEPDKKNKRFDGAGLFLLIKPNGSKYWRLKYYYQGKEKGPLALGAYPAVGLKDARQRAAEIKAQLAQGIEPGGRRKAQKIAAQQSSGNTFETLALEWWENKRDVWVPDHADRVIGYIRKDLFPDLGRRPLVEIEPAELLAVVRKVEKRGALDVASRELQFASAIFRFAIQTGRAKSNPATELKGALKSRKSEHRPSLKVADLPEFYSRLQASSSNLATKLAVRLTILTFLRPGEIRTARWQDFDLTAMQWRVPAPLMKMKTEHIVPLSRQVVSLLDQLRALSGRYELLFPGERNRKLPISEGTMNQCINRMGYQGMATPHGFRATASSLLNEKGFNSDAIERQLAHLERNKIRASYTHHAEYIEERSRMMQWWADYLEQLETGSNVIPVQFRAAAPAGSI